MSVKRVEPDQAAELVGEGWRYLDVRSIPEFEQGHPQGAYNVPLMHFEPGRGMSPNGDFLRVVRANFALEDRVVIGCKSGARSLKAAETLIQTGYTNVVDMRGGFSGEGDASGQVACAGWAARGLPISTTAESGRDYQALSRLAT